MTREYPERPIFGVGAILFREGKVLLIKRGRPPLMNTWSLPGGAQKLDETVEEALAREVREETGLKIRNIRLLEVIDILNRDGKGKVRHHYTVADFIADPEGKDLKPGGDAIDARWVPLKDLENVDLNPKTRDVIEKAWDLTKKQD